MSSSETCSLIKKQRSSNIELLRIVSMLLIVAHHYVVNSGLMTAISDNLQDSRSVYLALFGMWGKTALNCFVMITGWFMCTSRITMRKFLKLLLEVYFYRIVINFAFVVSGYQPLSAGICLQTLWPISLISRNFLSCYLLFFLFIPFLNLLIHSMDRRQHLLLLGLCLGMYTILGSIPNYFIEMNYVSWFCILYLLMAFVRLYPAEIFSRHHFWGWMTLILALVGMASVYVLMLLKDWIPIRFLSDAQFFAYEFVSDSNEILAVAIALSMFLWFKNMDIKTSRVINIIAESTFGVLLIHAHSNAMRRLLWGKLLNVPGQYELGMPDLICASVLSVLAVFVACVILDRFRIILFEKPFFKWYDKKQI